MKKRCPLELDIVMINKNVIAYFSSKVILVFL